MQYVKKSILLNVMALWCLFFVAGCASSDNSQCGSSVDCAGDEVCRAGICEVVDESQCSIDTDCPGGHICTNSTCVPTNTPTNNSTQPNNSTTNNSSPENNATTPNNNNSDENNNNNTNSDPVDPGNPTVTAVTPADGSMDVELSPTITVTFNKPMEARTINHHSFFVRNSDNQTVSAAPPEYDADTKTATLVLNEPLLPATEYRIVVNQNARDIANTSLFQQYEFVFYTAYSSPSTHSELAAEYSPVIYQAIRQPDTNIGVRTDIPTRVDFDGDLDANNNRNNSQSPNHEVRAHVYYNVIESPTHYFIQYVLYYPTRLESNTLIEHDLIGIVVIVDKDSREVVLAEGVEHADSDRLFAFKPTFSAVEGKNATAQNNLKEFPATGLESNTHYPLYVTGGNHSACNWFVPGSVFPPQCAHDAGKFPGGDERGVVIRLGDTANSFEEAELNVGSGFLEMTYNLLPFTDTFWLYRADYSCGLFEVPAEYQPQGDRPTGPGDQTLWLPRKLCSNDSSTYGRTPYQWARTGGAQDGGQWFLDPAYMMNWRYDFGEDVEFSSDYCYNIFFGIDRTNDSEHPECSL